MRSQAFELCGPLSRRADALLPPYPELALSPDLTTCVMSVRYPGLLWYTKNQSSGCTESHLACSHRLGTIPSIGIGHTFAKAGRPMGGSQGTERGQLLGMPPRTICLPPVCVRARYGMMLIIHIMWNATLPHTLAKVHHSIPYWIT